MRVSAVMQVVAHTGHGDCVEAAAAVGHAPHQPVPASKPKWSATAPEAQPKRIVCPRHQARTWSSFRLPGALRFPSASPSRRVLDQALRPSRLQRPRHAGGAAAVRRGAGRHGAAVRRHAGAPAPAAQRAPAARHPAVAQRQVRPHEHRAAGAVQLTCPVQQQSALSDRLLASLICDLHGSCP